LIVGCHGIFWFGCGCPFHRLDQQVQRPGWVQPRAGFNHTSRPRSTQQ
jgi:hypothetical protein